MTISLRERRREETALEIQRATLALATRSGLEKITTDEIALASGVSTRTFFNYYANKEAAAIGHPPTFTEAQLNALRESTGPLAADLKQLLDGHIVAMSANEDIMRLVGKILQSNEKARGILEGFLTAERQALTETLCYRVDNRQTAAALASKVTSAIGGAIFLWETDAEMSLSAALDVVWNGLIDASRLLLSSNDEQAQL